MNKKTIISSHTLLFIHRGIEKTEELIASGLDLHHFVPGTTSHARPRLSSIVDTSPASSPILSRRATVLEEWSQLQRSHSLSRSEPEKERTVVILCYNKLSY